MIRQAPFSFIVALVLASSVVWIFIHLLYAHRIKAKDATIETLRARLETETPRQLTNNASRLSSLKQQLRGYVIEADQMYEKILAEKVATQSLSEPERIERLRCFVAPNCRRWHADAEALVEKELGRSHANEFASDWKHLGAGADDWSDLDFLMKFLSRKRKLLRDLAKNITETGLE